MADAGGAGCGYYSGVMKGGSEAKSPRARGLRHANVAVWLLRLAACCVFAGGLLPYC